MSFGNLFSFQGRISRGSFWPVLASLIVLQGLVIALLLFPLISDGFPVPTWAWRLQELITALSVWILLATSAKRWHDLNLSGWMALTLLIPPINFLFLLYLGLRPGKAGTNKYGQ